MNGATAFQPKKREPPRKGTIFAPSVSIASTEIVPIETADWMTASNRTTAKSSTTRTPSMMIEQVSFSLPISERTFAIMAVLLLASAAPRKTGSVRLHYITLPTKRLSRDINAISIELIKRGALPTSRSLRRGELRPIPNSRRITPSLASEPRTSGCEIRLNGGVYGPTIRTIAKSVSSCVSSISPRSI